MEKQTKRYHEETVDQHGNSNSHIRVTQLFCRGERRVGKAVEDGKDDTEEEIETDEEFEGEEFGEGLVGDEGGLEEFVEGEDGYDGDGEGEVVDDV